LEPRIEIIPEKKFVGMKVKMSLSGNKTRELWQSFMPLQKEIKNKIGQELYSVEVYQSLYFNSFDPHRKFEKWAAIEVTDFDNVPDGMGNLVSPRGLYAIFLYKGAASKGAETFRYILGTWLPDSDFLIDNRPHFAVMGEKYKNEDPDSEEELWIPIKNK
jgi:AraC family transcriptional regulator